MSAPIAALGAGRMGRGIAIVFAYAGLAAVAIDIKPRDPAARAEAEKAFWAEIDAHLDTLAALGVLDPSARSTVRSRISFAGTQDAEAVLGAAHIVFEGVPEVAEHKRAALSLAGEATDPSAIIASTTSTFLVEELADHVAHPERFLNAHWLNPAYIIPLVELSAGKRTLPDVTARMRALLEAVGKVPVICAASPGFIVPRIQTLMMNEAARIVEEGVASAEDVDRATRFGLGFRYAALGLLEFIDYGGGDILFYASRYLTGALGDTRYAAPDIIERNMAEGRIGAKTGAGFYPWPAGTGAERQLAGLERLVAMLRHQNLLRPPGSVGPEILE
jgi:3-hydroxybutyryl-CoA dehydrogenase